MRAAIHEGIPQIEQLVRLGHYQQAEGACRLLIASEPALQPAWAWLGMLAILQNRASEAEGALRRAIELLPQDARAWNHLGLALRLGGDPIAAERAACQAVALASTAEHWSNLANCLFDLKRWEESSVAYQQALALQPQDTQLWTNLGAAEQALGRHHNASQAFEQALALSPGDIQAATRYALLEIQGDFVVRGVERIKQVIHRAPDIAAAWLVLGSGERLLDNIPAAEAAYRYAVSLAPHDRDANYNLVLTLLQRLQLVEAENIARQLIASRAADAEAWIALGGALHGQARLPEAVAAMRRSVELAPNATNHSKLLVALHYVDDAEPHSLLAEHLAWDERYARALAPIRPQAFRPLTADRPLRIGFVANDFCASPTGYLTLRGIECLDRTRCFVACYSDRLREDEYTARFQAASKLWRSTMSLRDEELARQIAQDELDVLIDLGGHVGRRLLTFARRPAPVQITWLGYVGTTGLVAMDGLIADRFHVRPGEESFHAEQVLRMPHSYACYSAPACAPAVGPLPALARGSLTFGCFNNPAKYSTRALDAWAKILNRLPTATLLLNYAGLQQQDLQARLLAEFATRGVGPERVQFEVGGDVKAMLEAYDRVDLALDTQPYSGGLTTCEALWMGVPVITCPGAGFASRHSTSYLTTAGLSQFVAQDMAGYISLAVEWSSKIHELAELRQQIRERLRGSPVCDGPQFGRDLLSLLTTTYETKAARAATKQVG